MKRTFALAFALAAFAAPVFASGAAPDDPFLLSNRKIYIRFFEYRDAGSPRLFRESAAELLERAANGDPLSMFIAAISADDPGAPCPLGIDSETRKRYLETSRARIEGIAEKNGNPLAQYLLGLADGDTAKLETAADNGNSQARIRLALGLLNSASHESDSSKKLADEKKAMDLLSKAASFPAGNKINPDASPCALNMLGRCYEKGRGRNMKNGKPDADFRYAFRAYSQAAKAGHPDALHNLSRLKYSGLGCKKNLAESLEAERAAAEAGHPDAMACYGSILESGMTGTNGATLVVAQPGAGCEMIERSAREGSKIGAHLYGRILRDSGDPSRKAEALEFLDKAARAGIVEAQFETATILLENESADPGDEIRAARYLSMAAAKGHAGAMSALSSCYEKGRGIQKSKRKATLWMMRARAARGDIAAAGWLVKHKDGVDRD